jgi:hypothetical protein
MVLVMPQKRILAMNHLVVMVTVMATARIVARGDKITILPYNPC